MIVLNDEKIENHKFPNNELAINNEQIMDVLYPADTNDIIFLYEDDSSLIELMMIKKFLDDKDVACNLTIPYMPYSRMDRVQDDESAFTLKYIANFINSLNFKSVEVFEPHSDVTPALLNNCKTKDVSMMIAITTMKSINFDKEKDVLFFPDAGASKRYSKINLDGIKTLVGYKERDFKSGNITKFDILGDIPKNGFKAIIVDDLCSKGGTCYHSAKKLKELGATEIHLVFAHCEDNIYNGELLKGDLITKIYTTKSILTKDEHEKIAILGDKLKQK